MKNVDKLLEEAEKLVFNEIHERVIKILMSTTNKADCFIMGNGAAAFFCEAELLDHRIYMNPVINLIEKYDQAFHLTGRGVRWDYVPGRGVTRSKDW